MRPEFQKIILGAAVILCLLCTPGLAAEQSWHYSEPGNEFGGIAIAGSDHQVLAGAGRIWVLSPDGGLVGKEPFGNLLALTPDGSFMVSEYSSTLYAFRKSPQARVSSDGRYIVALSRDGVKLFARNGRLIKKSDTTVAFTPEFAGLSARGDIMVFNDGLNVKAVFPGNGSVSWKKRADGEVSGLGITRNGAGVIVGTRSEIVERFDNGNLTWKYAPDPAVFKKGGVSCIAISDTGSRTAAGFTTGEVVLLDDEGKFLWMNSTGDPIRHIALQEKESLVAAASDNALHFFRAGTGPDQVQPAVSAEPLAHTVDSYTAPGMEETAPFQDVSPAIVTPEKTPPPVQTPYSQVRTQEQPAPLPWAVPVLCIVLGVLLCGRSRTRKP